jgi:hypothetical protein
MFIYPVPSEIGFANEGLSSSARSGVARVLGAIVFMKGSDELSSTERSPRLVDGLRGHRFGGNAHFAEPAAREFASFIFISRKDSMHV